MILGRIERPVSIENYLVHGRFVPRSFLEETPVGGEIRLGPHTLFPDQSGEFVARGYRSIGTRLEIDSEYVKVAASGVSLDGRGTYDLGEISLSPRSRREP